MNTSLSPHNIAAYLPTGHPFTLQVFPVLPSTNATAKELAAGGAPEGTVILAESQTAGRGRLRRSFYSPGGTGLYMSLILRPTIAPEDSLLITTAAAVAVAEAIEEVSAQKGLIKWVNDIFIGRRKVCGILTEAGFGSQDTTLDYAVLGIGINIQPPENGFPPEISEIAGAVFDHPVDAITRNRLAAVVLSHFWQYYGQLTEKTFLEEYRRRSLLTGHKVNVHPHGQESLPAIVLGVEDDLSLKVRLDSGEVRCLSTGEVSIRL